MPPVTQRTFIKGLDASTSKYDQPRGSLPRLSNFLFTRRGSLLACDGSRVIGSANQLNAAPIPSNGNGPIVAIQQFFKPSNQALDQAILYLQMPKPDHSQALLDPTGTALVQGGGGAMLNGSYDYYIQTLDAASDVGRHSSGASGPFTIVVAGGGGVASVQLTWNVVAGAGGYAVYRGPTGGGLGATSLIAIVVQPDYQQSGGVVLGGATATFTDIGNSLSVNQSVVLLSTSVGPLRLMIMTVFTQAGDGPVYNAPTLLGLFPKIVTGNIIGLGPNGDYGFHSNNSSGGLPGTSQPSPMMLEFAGSIVIALGSGVRPQYTDGTTVFPLTNTFTAQYINWQASTTYLVNDQIQATVSGTAYLFTCKQQGQSQTPGPPAFSATLGQITIDGQVVWVNSGPVTTSPAPRGGAHLANHAGSLWIFNTNPVDTADLLDGPTAIRMSDINNLSSWNPLNMGFIAKDDGSDGMSMASFTIAELGIAPLGSLIVNKDFSTYQIVGVFGSPNFAIQQMQTDMGNFAPRSARFIPGFGIIRLTHLGFAVIDGVRDRLISEQIRPYLFGSPSTGSPGFPAINGVFWPSVAFARGELISNPPMYVCAVPVAPQPADNFLTRLFCFDLVLRAWTVIDLPNTFVNGVSPTSYINSIYQLRSSEALPLTVVGGYDDGAIKTLQNGDAQWGAVQTNKAPLTLIPVAWAVSTPEVYNSQDTLAPIHAGQLFIKGVNLDGQPIKVTVNLQTEAGWIADTRVYAIGAGEFELVVGINEEVMSANALISGTGRVELESFVWDVAPLPSMVPYRIT